MAGKPFSEQLRQAVLRCGKSRYRISKETGITEAQLSRFVNGHADLALPTIDKLTECIGARLVTEIEVQRGEIKHTRKGKRGALYGKSC